MVGTGVTKRVLIGLANALPEEGYNFITRIEIGRGWGDAILVTIYASASLQHDPVDIRTVYKEAVEKVLAGERHLVLFEWDYHS
jgi:hypothetical protein